MRRVELGVAAVIAAAAAFAALAANGLVVLGGICAAAVVVLTVLGDRLLGRRYRSWGYCERSADLLVRRGVMFQRLTVVPYGRMQLVDVTAGAIERTFGLHTAAAATDARIPGLQPDEATRLRDRLAALGETQAAGI
jgi:hypothetical protein